MSGFLQVVNLEVAKAKLGEKWQAKLPDSALPITKAIGRVSSSDVVSQTDVPMFDRATYDGFAVKATDTFRAAETAPVSMALVGRVVPGAWPKLQLRRGACVGISTGAPMPKGSDAVVMSEHATVEGGRVIIYRAVSPSENVSKRGSDVKKGQIIVPKGRQLRMTDIAALAAVGVERILVRGKTKVAIISTGSELVKAGEKLGPGKVYDVNGPALSEAVRACGAEPIYLGIAPDKVAKIEEFVDKGLKVSDIVLVSGGSSIGATDLAPKVIDGMGRPGVIVHGLAMKPGKPAFIAVVRNKPIFGLPGYPVSALMVFDQLVADFLYQLSGIRREKRDVVRAKLASRLISARGRKELVPVRLVYRGGQRLAEPILKGSGAITSLSTADGYVEVPLEREIVDEGETVSVKLFGEVRHE